MTSKECPGTNPEPELCVWLKPGELLTNPSLSAVKMDGEKKKVWHTGTGYCRQRQDPLSPLVLRSRPGPRPPPPQPEPQAINHRSQRKGKSILPSFLRFSFFLRLTNHRDTPIVVFLSCSSKHVEVFGS